MPSGPGTVSPLQGTPRRAHRIRLARGRRSTRNPEPHRLYRLLPAAFSGMTKHAATRLSPSPLRSCPTSRPASANGGPSRFKFWETRVPMFCRACFASNANDIPTDHSLRSEAGPQYCAWSWNIPLALANLWFCNNLQGSASGLPATLSEPALRTALPGRRQGRSDRTKFPKVSRALSVKGFNGTRIAPTEMQSGHDAGITKVNSL